MPRITAPISTIYLADQLSTVFKFAERFWTYTRAETEIMIGTLQWQRVSRIRTLLSESVARLREPRRYGLYDFLDVVLDLEEVLRLIPDLNRANPRLRDNPVYKSQYEDIVEILADAIQHIKMHKLLIELQGP